MLQSGTFLFSFLFLLNIESYYLATVWAYFKDFTDLATLSKFTLVDGFILRNPHYIYPQQPVSFMQLSIARSYAFQHLT